MSENYEWFNYGVIGPLLTFTSDAELRAWLRSHRFIKGAKIHKQPLGSSLLRLLRQVEEPLPLVVQAHLHFENFLDAIIQRKFRHGSIILDRHDFTFALKVTVLRAKNYLPDSIYQDLLLVNSLRNKFAHNLFYECGDFDMSQFSYCESLKSLYGEIAGRKSTKSLVNVYIFKHVVFELLLRMTKAYPFIAELRIPTSGAT